MNRTRLSLLTLALGIATLSFTGCKSAYEHDSTGLYAKNNRGTNILGIVDTTPSSYKEIGQTTDAVRTNELYKRKNISGDNVSLLWGAFTFADY